MSSCLIATASILSTSSWRASRNSPPSRVSTKATARSRLRERFREKRLGTMDQNEVDSLMQEINKETGGAPPGHEGEMGWDDVKDELEKSRQAAPRAEVSDPDFNELQKTGGGRGSFDLDFILDIPLTLTVELGRCRMLINELLNCSEHMIRRTRSPQDSVWVFFLEFYQPQALL